MSIYASRYARAFAEAVEASKLDPVEIGRQLDDFDFAWKESTELRHLLENPVFPAEQKVAVLDKLNEHIGLSPLVRNFLAVVISNDRVGSLEEIVREYRLEMDRRNGIFEVGIISARQLEADERDELETRIGALVGGKLNAHYSEDTNLLGGVVVKVGSTVYDGSVRGRLDRLKEELAAS